MTECDEIKTNKELVQYINGRLAHISDLIEYSNMDYKLKSSIDNSMDYIKSYLNEIVAKG